MDPLINILRDLYHRILSDLDSINDDNFSLKLNSILGNIQNAENSKLSLLHKYKIEALRRFDEEFYLITKQIHSKFDYIIREKKEQSEKISQKLNDLQNHKKLVNYIR